MPQLVSSVDTLILLISNLVIGKMSLYKLNDWVGSIDLRCFGHKKPDSLIVSDDKFGRALDKLYHTARASPMMQIVLSAIKEFNINLAPIHNDSTMIEAYGDIAGVMRTGIELKRGYNPNRCSNLKQLIFNLSIGGHLFIIRTIQAIVQMPIYVVYNESFFSKNLLANP